MSFDDDIELPWPRPGDVLFGEAPDWWMNARVNYGGGLMYAIGYRTGGDALVERVAQTHSGARLPRLPDRLLLAACRASVRALGRQRGRDRAGRAAS